MERTENLYIEEIRPLISPKDLKRELPLPDDLAGVVVRARGDIQRILTRKDARPLIITGPCSLHDEEATLEYATRLRRLQQDLGEKVLLVMRAYFEKPRTTVGWKGMLYDPWLDESDDIQEGFRRSRRLLLEITRIGLPAATEILDPIVPQYLTDMVSWASIGARTAASQIHRQMASGLSMPIGFKNSTDGNLKIAIEAIKTASRPHVFLGITAEGQTGIASTRGNPHGHLVLRGGASGPNYQSEYVAFAEELQRKAGIANGIIIDCSHANANKDHRQQRVVFHDVLEQIRAGNRSIAGMMLESFLFEGNQSVPEKRQAGDLRPEAGGKKEKAGVRSPEAGGTDGSGNRGAQPSVLSPQSSSSPPASSLKSQVSSLHYGVSVTDKCIAWEETEELIRHLAKTLA
jgi:3-deoxy-7-phosphoheptulonate synthase